jgi:hypothetical protein
MTKETLLACGLIALVAVVLLMMLLQAGGTWLGIDETVVNVVARQAGRAPRLPIINLARGDLEIFFLAAGSVGGFVAGLCFHALFMRSHNVGSR